VIGGGRPRRCSEPRRPRVGQGSTTRATSVRCTATTTTPRTATSAFAAPELTSGSAFMALPAKVGVRRNAMAAGVLVEMPGGIPNARRPVGAVGQ
jgi:hypothetical protein